MLSLQKQRELSPWNTASKAQSGGVFHKFPAGSRKASAGGKESPNGEKVFSCIYDQITLIVPI